MVFQTNQIASARASVAAQVAGSQNSHGNISRWQVRMESFGNLPNGWYHGRGTAASPRTIAMARSVAMLFQATGFESIQSFPVASGEILVTGSRGLDEELSAVVLEGKIVVFTYEYDDLERLRVNEPDLDTMLAKIDLINKNTKNGNKLPENSKFWDKH